MGGNQSFLSIEYPSACKQLISAVNRGDAESIRELLVATPFQLKASAEAGPFATHGSGFLHLAAQRGQLSSVLALCDFILTCEEQVLNLLTRHFVKRSNVSTPIVPSGDIRQDALKYFVNCANKKGQGALTYACYYGSPEVVSALLERGADIYAQDRCGGKCALHYACLKGHVSCIQVLLNFVQQNHLDGPPNTPSTTTTARLEPRRYVDVCSMLGVQPLHLAVAKGHLEAVRALLSFRPRVAAPLPMSSYLDSTCQAYTAWSTPLHIAAQKGHADVAMELMAACVYQMQLEGRLSLSGDLEDLGRAENEAASFFSSDLRRCVDGDRVFPCQIAAMYGHTDLAEALTPWRPLSQFIRMHGLDIAGMAERIRNSGVGSVGTEVAAARMGAAAAQREARRLLTVRLEELRPLVVETKLRRRAGKVGAGSAGQQQQPGSAVRAVSAPVSVVCSSTHIALAPVISAPFDPFAERQTSYERSPVCSFVGTPLSPPLGPGARFPDPPEEAELVLSCTTPKQLSTFDVRRRRKDLVHMLHDAEEKLDYASQNHRVPKDLDDQDGGLTPRIPSVIRGSPPARPAAPSSSSYEPDHDSMAYNPASNAVKDDKPLSRAAYSNSFVIDMLDNDCVFDSDNSRASSITGASDSSSSNLSTAANDFDDDGITFCVNTAIHRKKQNDVSASNDRHVSAALSGLLSLSPAGADQRVSNDSSMSDRRRAVSSPAVPSASAVDADPKGRRVVHGGSSKGVLDADAREECIDGPSGSVMMVAAADDVGRREDGDDTDEDDDHTCGICLTEFPSVTATGCGHRICVDCALNLCRSGNEMRAVLCPFCRAEVKGFDLST